MSGLPSSTRILILGGRGRIGRHVASACRALPAAEVVVGGRSESPGRLAIDLTDSANLKQLAGFDFVVNCTDAARLPPDRAAAWSLHGGGTYLELSADPVVVERLWRDLGDDPDPVGRVILGCGLFPGVSGLLAAELVDRGPRPQSLEIAVELSLCSVAGLGTCHTLAGALGRPAVRYAGRRRWSHEPLRVAGTVTIGGRQRSALSVGLVDGLLLHWGTGVESTGSLLVPSTPPLPRSAQRLLTSFSPWQSMALSPVRWLLGNLVFALRGGVFRWRDPRVRVAAIADRGQPTERRIEATAKHAMAAVGQSVASAIECLRAEPAEPGVHLLDHAVPSDRFWRAAETYAPLLQRS